MDVIYRFDPYAPIETRNFATPDEALACLLEGHLTHAKIVQSLRNAIFQERQPQIIIPSCIFEHVLSLIPGVAPVQRPFAIVVSCSDARVPVEHVFQVHANGVFVVRTAGHIIGRTGMGSILYALRNFSDSIKLVAILGHTECGAVTAAVDSMTKSDQSGSDETPSAIQSIVEQIQPSAVACSMAGSDLLQGANQRSLLIESAGYVHAARIGMELKEELLQKYDIDIKVVYGAYDLGQMRIRHLPRHATQNLEQTFLADVPANNDHLDELVLRCATHVGKDNL